MIYKNIYEMVPAEENAYRTVPITVADGYEWNMYEHIRTTVLYKNWTFKTGKDDNKPFKNIIRPILNLHYRAEGFDVKDIVLFLNDKYKYFKSFLIRKYHELWARENAIDTFIDDLVETWVDFGGVLVKNLNKKKPEVVKWESIAFCDQTDFLSGPFAIKHFFSPDQLKEMSSRGWGDKKNGATTTINDLIHLAKNEKKEPAKMGKPKRTPGKYIELYEVHGTFPEAWLEGNDYYAPYEEDEENFIPQFLIIGFYKDENNQDQGVCLYKAEQPKEMFKFLPRDPVYGRALGVGAVEELFEPQVWVNYSMIHQKQILDHASKNVYQTADTAFANRNVTTDVKQGQILVYEDNKPISQIDTIPRNLVAFENSVKEWEQHARQMGAATESIMGESPSSGTPFKLQELITAESHSLHEYRKGKIATFLDEVYQDWIIPHIAQEVSKGKEFIAELDFEEMQEVLESISENLANRERNEQVLNGVIPSDKEILKQEFRALYSQGGNKKFLELLEGEMKDSP